MMVLVVNRGWTGVVGKLPALQPCKCFQMGLKTQPGFISEGAYIWNKKRKHFETKAALIQKGFSYTGN